MSIWIEHLKDTDSRTPAGRCCCIMLQLYQRPGTAPPTFVFSLKTLKHTRICTSTSCNYVLRKSKRYQWFSYLLHRQQLIFKQFWIGTRAKLLEGGMKGFKKWWYSWHECWHLASCTCLVCSSSCPDAPEGRLKTVTAGNKSWQQATAVGEQQKC